MLKWHRLWELTLLPISFCIPVPPLTKMLGVALLSCVGVMCNWHCRPLCLCRVPIIKEHSLALAGANNWQLVYSWLNLLKDWAFGEKTARDT